MSERNPFGSRLSALRFPLVVGLIAFMLFSMEKTIDQVARGVNQPLYYSARLEETSKMDMEATRLFDNAERYVAGVPGAKIEDVQLALDLFWSRVTVGKTKNYQAVLSEEMTDAGLIAEIADRLPDFDVAVQALKPGDPDSIMPLRGLKEAFGPRLHALGELAWTQRQTRMSELVQRNLSNVAKLRDIQIGFVLIAILSLAYVLFELFQTRKLNLALNGLVEEKQALLRTDLLTGIANRARFEERLAELSAPIAPNFSVIYLDLDGFKQVNDTLGHAAGDKLLKDVAQILQSLAGPDDTVSRFGGDEFAVLLSGSRMRAENFLAGLAPRVLALQPGGPNGPRVSVSCGSCHASDLLPSEAPVVLMRHADLALYAAKDAGRNCARPFRRSMLEVQSNRQLVESLLPQAIEADRLDAVYQPIIRLEDGQVASVEALVRWHDPMLGQVPADRIIDVAEATGRIGALTLAVLNKAIGMRQELRARGYDLPVSVNLSPTLLNQPGFATDVARTLAQLGIEPGGILFEVTEYAQIEDNVVAEGNLKDLRLAGIPIAVDDFGKAFSSVQRLMHLDFRYLKLDRLLVENITSSARALQILTGLNSLAEELGAEVISEGIETEEQLQLIRKAGIRNAQGFHLSRPLMRDDLLAFVEAGTEASGKIVRFQPAKPRG